jgi:hypothetical protein
MRIFERELAKHLSLPAVQQKYKKKDADFDVKEWQKKGLIHVQHHPAHDWIVKWSREHGHSYRSKFLLPLDEKCYIFDGLHGTINVINIMNKILKDIQTNNGCTCKEGTKTADGSCCCDRVPVQRPLVDIMSVILPQLSVPGKHEDEYSVDSLNGNDSITLLNSFPGIVCQLLAGLAKTRASPYENRRFICFVCFELLCHAMPHAIVKSYVFANPGYWESDSRTSSWTRTMLARHRCRKRPLPWTASGLGCRSCARPTPGSTPAS